MEMLGGRWQTMAEKSRQSDETKLIEDLARGASNSEAARRLRLATEERRLVAVRPTSVRPPRRSGRFWG